MTGLIKVVAAEELFAPRKAYPSDVGYDIRAYLDGPVVLAPGQRKLIPCGFSLCMPPGVCAEIRPRSGLALKYGLTVLNSPGTIDTDYTGEIKVILINHGDANITIACADRIAQIVFAQKSYFFCQIVDFFDTTPGIRGSSGFGSTGEG